MHNRKSFSKVTTASSTAVAVMTVGCGVAFVRWRKAFRPRIIAEPTRFNESILKLCPTLHENYHLPGFLHNGHVETIFAALFRKRPHLMYDRELVHMPDGGVVSLDREKVEPEQELSPNAPIIILLPGLTGGSEDTYVQHAVVHAREAGFRAVVFNPRGCSDSPVTTAQFYSASYTGDLRKVIDHVSAKSQGAPIFAAGWSLGANILCRYLGEQKDDVRLSAAVAMCNPFDLPLADRNFKKGFNRVYDFNLAKSLRRIYSKHHHLFEEASNKNLKSYNPERALYASTIREFDDAITRISFNWPSVDSYYTGSSSALSIPDIKIPLLVVQAEDDPIAPKEAIPFDSLRKNRNCITVLTPTGGHLGWCSGEQGITGAPWTDKVVIEYLKAILKLQSGPHTASLADEPEGVFTVSVTSHQAP